MEDQNRHLEKVLNETDPNLDMTRTDGGFLRQSITSPKALKSVVNQISSNKKVTPNRISSGSN
jgi:hypothetical protein